MAEVSFCYQGRGLTNERDRIHQRGKPLSSADSTDTQPGRARGRFRLLRSLPSCYEEYGMLDSDDNSLVPVWQVCTRYGNFKGKLKDLTLILY